MAMKLYTLHMDEDWLDELRQLATEQGTTVSQLIRGAVGQVIREDVNPTVEYPELWKTFHQALLDRGYRNVPDGEKLIRTQFHAFLVTLWGDGFSPGRIKELTKHDQNIAIQYHLLDRRVS